MTLQNLSNFPEPRQIIKAENTAIDTAKAQSNFNELNATKAGLGTDNVFSGANVFEGLTVFDGGIKITSTDIINENKTISQLNNVFDTTENAITVTLPDCEDVLSIGLPFKFYFLTKGASNTVTINASVGNSVDASGRNTITMDTEDDFISIIPVSANRWMIEQNNGCSLSTT